MRVLVVESDRAMRELLRDVLEGAGHLVVERADGTDLADGETFDAVVLDPDFPGDAGDTLLERFQDRRPSVPVIVITAFGGTAFAEAAARRGAYACLEKPFRVSRVLDTLASAGVACA